MRKFRTVCYEIGEKTKRAPLVFVHLSDLHGCCYGENQEGLLEAVKMLGPDAVLVTGDMIASDRNKNQRTVAFLGRLSECCPVFFTNGNHETRYGETKGYDVLYAQFLHGLAENRVILLNNDSVDWEQKGRKLRIAGYEPGLEYYGRISRKIPPMEELTEKLGTKSNRETILLAHNPMFFPAYKEWGAELTFSGHLHGGYIRIPGIGGIISPQFHLFPKYDRGIFKEEGHYLCVSAGLGDHTVSPRFFNPAQLVSVIWH